jgi:hypothetical protein
MPKNNFQGLEHRPAGYTSLIDRYKLKVLPNWHESYVASSGIHRIYSFDNMTREIYPPKYWPGQGLGENLEFALKYDGTNLAILDCIFRAVAL